MQENEKNQSPNPKPTLLTEHLPAGGLTQESFKHQGSNVMPKAEEVEKDEDAQE